MSVSSSNYRILIIVEAPCVGKFEQAISAFDVAGDIYDYIEQLRGSGRDIQMYPVTNFFGSTLSKIIKLSRSLNFNDFVSEFYVLAPIGLLTDKDFVPPYRECFETLSKEDLSKILVRRKIKDRVYDLLESEFDIGIFCMSYKLASALNIDYYVPVSRPVIMITEGYSTSKKNIYVITARHIISNFLQRKEVLSLCEGIIGYVQKMLSIDSFRENIFKKLVSSPSLLLEELFNIKNLKSIFRKKQTRQADIRKFLRQRG